MTEPNEAVILEATKLAGQLEDKFGLGSSKIGTTKKDKSQDKKARRMSKATRKANRNKKRHHKTSKEKKARK